MSAWHHILADDTASSNNSNRSREKEGDGVEAVEPTTAVAANTTLTGNTMFSQSTFLDSAASKHAHPFSTSSFYPPPPSSTSTSSPHRFYRAISATDAYINVNEANELAQASLASQSSSSGDGTDSQPLTASPMYRVRSCARKTTTRTSSLQQHLHQNPAISNHHSPQQIAHTIRQDRSSPLQSQRYTHEAMVIRRSSGTSASLGLTNKSQLIESTASAVASSSSSSSAFSAFPISLELAEQPTFYHYPCAREYSCSNEIGYEQTYDMVSAQQQQFDDFGTMDKSLLLHKNLVDDMLHLSMTTVVPSSVEPSTISVQQQQQQQKPQQKYKRTQTAPNWPQLYELEQAELKQQQLQQSFKLPAAEPIVTAKEKVIVDRTPIIPPQQEKPIQFLKQSSTPPMISTSSSPPPSIRSSPSSSSCSSSTSFSSHSDCSPFFVPVLPPHLTPRESAAAFVFPPQPTSTRSANRAVDIWPIVDESTEVEAEEEQVTTPDSDCSLNSASNCDHPSSRTDDEFILPQPSSTFPLHSHPTVDSLAALQSYEAAYRGTNDAHEYLPSTEEQDKLRGQLENANETSEIPQQYESAFILPASIPFSSPSPTILPATVSFATSKTTLNDTTEAPATIILPPPWDSPVRKLSISTGELLQQHQREYHQPQRLGLALSNQSYEADDAYDQTEAERSSAYYSNGSNTSNNSNSSSSVVSARRLGWYSSISPQSSDGSMGSSGSNTQSLRALNKASTAASLFGPHVSDEVIPSPSQLHSQLQQTQQLANVPAPASAWPILLPAAPIFATREQLFPTTE